MNLIANANFRKLSCMPVTASSKKASEGARMHLFAKPRSAERNPPTRRSLWSALLRQPLQILAQLPHQVNFSTPETLDPAMPRRFTARAANRPDQRALQARAGAPAQLEELGVRGEQLRQGALQASVVHRLPDRATTGPLRV